MRAGTEGSGEAGDNWETTRCSTLANAAAQQEKEGGLNRRSGSLKQLAQLHRQKRAAGLRVRIDESNGTPQQQQQSPPLATTSRGGTPVTKSSPQCPAAQQINFCEADPYSTPPRSPVLAGSSPDVEASPPQSAGDARSSSTGYLPRRSSIVELWSDWSTGDSFDLDPATAAALTPHGRSPPTSSRGGFSFAQLQLQQLHTMSASPRKVARESSSSNGTGAASALVLPNSSISQQPQSDSRRGSLSMLHAGSSSSSSNNIAKASTPYKLTSSFPVPSGSAQSSPTVSPPQPARRLLNPAITDPAAAAAAVSNSATGQSLAVPAVSANGISPANSSPHSPSSSASPPWIPRRLSPQPPNAVSGSAGAGGGVMPPLPPLHARGALQFATQQHQQMQQQWDAAAGYATQQPNPFLYGPYVHPYAGQAPANMQPYATAAPPFYYPSPSPTSASPEYEAAVYAQHLAAQQLQLQQQRGFAPPTQAQSLYSTIRPPSVGFRHTESAESVDEQQYARSTKPAISRARSAVSTTLRPPQQPQPQQHSHAYPAPPDDDSDHDPHGDGRSASPSESESSGDGGGGGRGGGEEEGDGPGGVGEGGGEEGRNGYGTRRSHRLAHHPHSHTESQEDISGLRAVAVYNGWPNSHAAAAGSVASAVSSSSIASMRKAASAADFKSYTSPARNRTTLRGASSGAGTGIGHANANAHRNLGVLTTFYASGGSGAGSTAAGLNGTQPNTGSLNASGHGSSNSLSNMRVSTSHAALSSAIGGPHSISAASASSASASRALLSRSHSGVIPPLIPQFSLTSSHHYDGQPRRRRAEIAMVTDKLRDMQYEIGRLSRKIKEYEEDTEQWSLRYSRRIVILSNVSLGVWIFLLQFLDGIRTRSVQDTWLTRMFIPRGVLSMAKAASPTSASAAANSLPLSGVLISGFLTGVQSSILFLLSAGLQNRSQSWSRNTGFLLSTGYSLYLLLLRRKDVRPHVGNWFNVVSNFIYLVTRYYFLHGLLVFNSMRIL